MSKHLFIVEVVVSHSINFEKTPNGINVDQNKQDVHIHSIKMKPGLSLDKFTGKAYYDGNISEIFNNSVDLLSTNVNILDPKPLQSPQKSNVKYTTWKNKPGENKEKSTQDEFGEADNKEKSTQDEFGEADNKEKSTQDEFGEADEINVNFGKDDENDDDDKINESNNLNSFSLNESEINNNRNLSFMITTSKLKFSKVVELDDKDETFNILIIPESIKDFVNYIESKKIKLFVNGIELKAKNELYF